MTLKELAVALFAAIETYLEYAVCPSYAGLCRHCGSTLPSHSPACVFLVAQHGLVTAMRAIEKKLD